MINLLVGWALLWGLYVMFMRGYSTPDRSRQAGFDYRREVGQRFGLLPPSRDPIGLILWVLTGLGFLAGIGFFLIGDRYVGTANGIMLGAFMVTLWRDNRWLKQQPDYLAALEAASARHGTKAATSDDPDEGDDADEVD